MVDPRVVPLHATLRLNTRLLLNCLDGLDDAVGIGFIAAHLVDARHLLARVIGLDAAPPYGGALETARGIDDVAVVPRLSDTRRGWREISVRVEGALLHLGSDALDAPAPQRYPIDDRSVLGAIAFLVQHDGYHIGQLALIRKFLGAPAMRYG